MTFNESFFALLRRGSDARSRFPKLERIKKDELARSLMAAMTIFVTLLVPLMIVALLIRAWPIIKAFSLKTLLLSTTWRPMHGEFGFRPFIIGTLWVTIGGMLLAVPPSLLTAIYLSEYAHIRTRQVIMPVIDLLAGIPSVVYGVWGTLTVVPLIEYYIAPVLKKSLGFLPLFQSDNPTGFGILAGGIVLAVMVFPVIIAVAEDVIRAAPQGLREASFSLGATKWQTVTSVVLRRSWPGVMAAIVLGFSRAFGETMAVLMVVGNVPKVPGSIFDAAYPLTALIANNYGEMMSIPLYDSALMGGALILLLILVGFNLLSRAILIRLLRR